MSPEQLLGEMEESSGIVICDLEAGIGTSLRLRPDEVDVVVVVAEPTVKSLEVAERVAAVAARRGAEVVVAANRVTGPADAELVRHRLGVDHVVEIPDDPSITAADRTGVAPIDVDPASPGVAAIRRLADVVLRHRDSAA